jgi:LuxR family transcriptional regulator, maltose regulon positive regulatory protein
MARELDQPFWSFVLMATKLSTPARRAGSVARPGLVASLESGRSAKLTLVSAPTGWGKTSLLAEWAARSSARFAWVSLDRGDDEPLRFWRYVVAALYAAEPVALAVAERRLRGPVVSITEEVLPVLVNGLVEVEHRLVLVLDDFHLIMRAETLAQVDYLLDRLPPALHVAVATQSDPRLRLGRLRALGDLAELRGEQLRFSDEEATSLLNRVHGLDLAADEIAILQHRTEGWVAGLNLAALTLKHRDRREHVLDELPADDRFLVDYLWDEVVLAQPREVRQFLMRTAILERLCASLCDEVAERSGSAAVLQELERANLFIVALDPGREWYRYHQLFRVLLLRQLERFAADVIPDLHRRASNWYASHGLMIEAIDHAITAGDVHWAADELANHWLAFYSAGQASTLLNLIGRLPPEAVDAHPVIALVGGGLARVLGRLEEVESWLARAERAPGGTPAPGMATSLAGGIALVRLTHRLAVGDADGAAALGRQALALEPLRGSREHATAGYFLAVALFYTDLSEARSLLSEFLNVVAEGEQDVRRYFAMALLAEIGALSGDTEAARELAADALAVARSRGLEEHSSTCQVHLARGAVAFADGRLSVAEDEFERALVLTRRGEDRLEHAHALVWLARLRARERDLTAAHAACEAARRLVPELGVSILPALVGMLERELEGSQPKTDVPPPGEPPTPAEMRVLRLMPTDLSYREIAQHLYLSLSTVRTHARHIRHKLGAPSRAESVATARELGLL